MSMIMLFPSSHKGSFMRKILRTIDLKLELVDVDLA